MTGREIRITKAIFKKFCGFDDFVVSFDPLTCLVGPNNGGKTTILKGIRFVLDAIAISSPTYAQLLTAYEKRQQEHIDQTQKEKEALEKELETTRQKALITDTGPDEALRKRKQTERANYEEQRRKQLEQQIQQRQGELQKAAPKWTCPLDAVLKRQNIENFSHLCYKKNARVFPSITLRVTAEQKSWDVSAKIQTGNNNQVEIEAHEHSETAIKTQHMERQLFEHLSGLRYEVVPPIGQLLPSENDLPYPNVQDTINTGRPADVWRNRIRWLFEQKSPEDIRRVIDRISDSIPGFVVNQPGRTRENPPKIALSYREHDVQYDISSSGTGVQMLLAVSAWIVLSDANILLIDEPDAHLHSLIQRQLAALLEEGVSDSRQIIIASHAPDLIDELPADSIEWIDRHENGGSRCNDIEKTLIMLGFVSNRTAIGFLKSDVHLYFEDKPDERILRVLMKKAGKEALFQRARRMKLHGCGDAKYLSGLSRLLQSCFHKTVATVGLIDSDYRPEQKSQVEDSVLIACLPCKELENLLLLQPATVHSVTMELIAERVRNGDQIEPPSIKDIEAKIDEITSSTEITEVARNNYILKAPNRDGQQVGPDAFDVNWGYWEYRRRRAPGKMVLAKLRQWLQDQYKVSFSLRRCFERDEYKIDESLRALFDEIDNHVSKVLTTRIN